MSANSFILFCFALKPEGRPFAASARAHPAWRVIYTGMGSHNAAKTIRLFLAAARPRLVLSSGFAGALNPALARDALVFAADEAFPLTPALTNAGALSGRFYDVDRIIVSSAEKASLWQATAADAVDMESASIRALCREQGIPSATVRIISDTAQDELPLDFNRYLRPDRGMDYAALIMGLLKSPGKIKDLMAFHRHTQNTARKLGQFLRIVLNDGT
jgi:adenosylhomocysteine nucleosidase